MNRATPRSHPFISRIFHEINHPLIKITPLDWKPPFMDHILNQQGFQVPPLPPSAAQPPCSRGAGPTRCYGPPGRAAAGRGSWDFSPVDFWKNDDFEWFLSWFVMMSGDVYGVLSIMVISLIKVLMIGMMIGQFQMYIYIYIYMEFSCGETQTWSINQWNNGDL